MIHAAERPQEAEIDVRAVIEQLDRAYAMIGDTPSLAANPLSPTSLADLGSVLGEEPFEDAEQFEALRGVLLAQLPPGSPKFEPPRARFREVPLPDGVRERIPART